jgi:hypothetical protein
MPAFPTTDWLLASDLVLGATVCSSSVAVTDIVHTEFVADLHRGNAKRFGASRALVGLHPSPFLDPLLLLLDGYVLGPNRAKQ